jgi:hypothetical protein
MLPRQNKPAITTRVRLHRHTCVSRRQAVGEHVAPVADVTLPFISYGGSSPVERRSGRSSVESMNA